MITLNQLVHQAQQGNQEAFSAIVQRFQDMAVGYSYAALGDMELARDAAQEAFLSAYLNLSGMRDPQAFPSWFRRLVHTQINRIQRRKQPKTVTIGHATKLESETARPDWMAEQREQQQMVWSAIESLGERQRVVVTLFYMSEYSQKEIGEFLDIPVATVKTRLHTARKQLKERIVPMLKENLYQQRPSRNSSFQDDLNQMIDLVKLRPKERLGDYPSIVDLQEIMGDPTQREQVWFWEDANDRMVGFAIVDSKYHSIRFEHDPSQAESGIVQEMLIRAAEQLRAAGCDTMRTACRDTNTERVVLLNQHGFTPEPVGTLHWQRSLTEPLPPVQLPEGFTIRPTYGEAELDKLVELHQAAFGTKNMTVEYRRAMMTVPEYEPELDLLMIAPDGTPVAFCVGGISVEENELVQQQEGWLDPVGTHPDYQRQGFAKILMLAGLHALKERSMTTAFTNCWGGNVAMRHLAESVGFTVAATTTWYTKSLK